MPKYCLSFSPLSDYFIEQNGKVVRPSFNSILVRLQLKDGIYHDAKGRRFNSILVRLYRKEASDYFNSNKLFQFYISTIIQQSLHYHVWRERFQFYISTIIHGDPNGAVLQSVFQFYISTIIPVSGTGVNRQGIVSILY